MAELPNVMKTRDLALMLDLSPDAVNDLARKGVLKGYKSGNQWRFRKKDVERFLTAGKGSAGSP
jgi:excisionase family DNA binding protein